MIRDATRRPAVHMAGAFFAMGGWALLANARAPLPDMVLAGVVQGSLSAGLTLAMKALTEAAVRRAPAPTARLLAPALCALVSALVLSSLHWLAGTPRILLTMLVPLTLSTVYAALYANLLTRTGKGRHGKD